jgi:hypothetical protein
MVQDWQVVRNSEEAIAALQNSEFDVRSTAVIEIDRTEDISVPGQREEGNPGRSWITEYSPERVAIQKTGPSGLLVLTDAYYAGWSATIDNKPVPIYPTDGLFRGVFVPPGDHEIVFQYASNLYLAGLIFFIFTSGIIAIVWANLFVKSRRKM